MKSILHCRHGYSLIVCHCHFFFFLVAVIVIIIYLYFFFGLLSLSLLVDIMMLILFWHTLNKDNVTGDFFFPIKKKMKIVVYSSGLLF